MEKVFKLLPLNLHVSKQGDQVSLTNFIVQEDLRYCHESNLHRLVIVYRCEGIKDSLI